MATKRIRTFTALAAAAGVLALLGYLVWPALINAMLPRDSRPGEIIFPVETVTPKQLDAIARDLARAFPGVEFTHVERFRKAGILAYEGPKTCLSCHATIKVKDATTGKQREVDLMEDVTTSAHYSFFTDRHPNVWGFDGRLADNFPMGKIDRPCPKPGSFAFTAWAEQVTLKDGRVLSEGCGQCHIGGEYQAPLGALMPGYRTTAREKDTIDCLICHSAGYDMNRKQVVVDPNGLARWEEDRSMRAAVSVGKTTAQTCLRCHQHNFGGDVYVDPADPSFMQSQRNPGRERPRVLHPGSKRGTPYSPSWDVHAAAGLACTECHVTEGHLIAKGLHTTTMMANDLPNVAVACETCHTAAPHGSGVAGAAELNRHTSTVACETCHIPSLQADNATMRDFSRATFEEDEGIWIYSDIEKETAPGKGIVYAWWNGDGTFLGNPIGDNPNGKGLYRFYKLQHPWPEFAAFDYAGWYERTMRPIARAKPSKLYAMKLYNGKQHIDLANMGPFGGMFVPYNLPTYYATGDPGKAAQRELAKPMMAMMYGSMFKVYLMDDFMAYMDAGGWDPGAYRDALALKRVEPRWIPTDALMEINHAIRREGALTCPSCHGPTGVLDWSELGYTAAEAGKLSSPRVK
jgi:hypothetical protein